MDFAKSMIFALSILAFAWWIGIIMQAEGEEKLTEACYPVTFTGSKIQQLTTSLVGYTPNWTYSFRRVMEGGCYYFFTIIFSPTEESEYGSGIAPVNQSGSLTPPPEPLPVAPAQ